MYVAVVLPLPLSESFTYSVPEDLNAKPSRGSRVLVPFGRRRLTGVVVDENADAAELEGIRPVLHVFDEIPSFTEELLNLSRWIADYYVCSLGEVIRAVLPPGGSGDRSRPTARSEKHIRFAPAFRHEGAVRELRHDLPGGKQVAVIECLAGFRAEGEHEPRQADLLDRAEASHSTVSSLLRRGIVEVVEKRVLRTPFNRGEQPEEPIHIELHEGQRGALINISEAIETETFRAFLLQGVTGSGKTQVYIEALKQVLEAGRSGIILVPEIALTPQTVRRFRSHFGDRIAVFHSRMSRGERFDAWQALRTGRFDVVIGPRSAILMPLTNVGLVIVDEEHESSYKQHDPAPRYHARDVAVMRARMNNAVCVLGSATPSLESLLNARTGRYTLLTMPERVPVAGGGAATLPDVRIVDLRVEHNQGRLQGVFSRALIEAVRQRVERKEQVVILQNRRGYAPLVQCRGCGWTPECPDCSVSMTLHKSRRHLRCHYCGRTARLPSVCPACSAEALDHVGSGTQRVEEELAHHIPDVRIIRMDLDTTTGKNAHDSLLRRFGAGKADVLLGTQMVAKGLDFARVTLVGVINADLGMMLPDFRAEERTFQLLAQVSGRAGRARLAGEVIIQTRNPDRPIIRYARDHDYSAFADAALGERRQMGYPPFGRLAAVEFKGTEEGRVEELAREWTAVLRKNASGVEILGPEPAFISRVKRQYRFHSIVKAGRRTGLQEILHATSSQFGNPPSRYRVNIDVDPVGLL